MQPQNIRIPRARAAEKHQLLKQEVLLPDFKTNFMIKFTFIHKDICGAGEMAQQAEAIATQGSEFSPQNPPQYGTSEETPQSCPRTCAQ